MQWWSLILQSNRNANINIPSAELSLVQLQLDARSPATHEGPALADKVDAWIISQFHSCFHCTQQSAPPLLFQSCACSFPHWGSGGLWGRWSHWDDWLCQLYACGYRSTCACWWLSEQCLLISIYHLPPHCEVPLFIATENQGSHGVYLLCFVN